MACSWRVKETALLLAETGRQIAAREARCSVNVTMCQPTYVILKLPFVPILYITDTESETHRRRYAAVEKARLPPVRQALTTTFSFPPIRSPSLARFGSDDN